MKNNYYLGVLTFAVILLYIIHFTSPCASRKRPVSTNTDTTKAAPAFVKNDTIDSTETSTNKNIIAYVNMDTLLEKYQFAKDVNAHLLKKQKDASAKLNDQGNKLRSDYAKVEEKYRKGLLSQTEAQAESDRLMKQQQEIQKLNNSLSQNLLDEQNKFNKQMQDTILKFFKEYNADKHYMAIFSNADNNNILYAEKQLNITSEVIALLNKRYKANKK